MNDKLNILIAFYEEEKARQLQLIDEYVREQEFQLAHFHQKALYQVNRRLQNLKNIDDNLYSEKSFKQNTIDNLEKLLESQSSDYMRDFLTQELSKEKEELNALNNTPKKVNTSDNAPLLDEVLTNLIEKKIKSFKLILKKTDSLFLEFKYYNKVLKVTLPLVKQHIKKWTLYPENIHSFKNLEFDLTDNENKLVLKLAGNKEEVLSKLKLILSKIVFEIFYFKDFENESYIEIKNKVRR